MRRIVVLGSTGSIGTQTVDVVRQHPDELEIVGLAVNTRVADMLEQARPHISPAASTNNGPIAGRLQQRHRRRGPGSVFRTLRRPVRRLVRGSEGAGQGAAHGRERSEN